MCVPSLPLASSYFWSESQWELAGQSKAEQHPLPRPSGWHTK